MGCASSKTDELPAVILCRDRLNHLSEALHHRYLLSEAHLSYIQSLQSVGLSLHRFFDTAASLPSPPSPPHPPPQPPNLKLADGCEANNTSGHLSSSNSGSHLHFHSDSDEDHEHLHDDDHDHGSGSGSGHLHLHDEPEAPRRSVGGGGGGMMMYDEGGFGGGSGYGPGMGMVFNPYFYSGNNSGYNINYMKKHVTPSVSYEQRPVSYETQTVQFGNPNNNYYDYFGGNSNGYMGNFGGGGGGGGADGYFGPPPGSQRGGGWMSGMPPQQMGPTKQQAPPPPPPPPAASSWDFMNLFESIDDNHYPVYRTPSMDSKEVREEEGIPDLEDGDYAHEVVKEVHGHQKLVVDEGGSGGESSIGGGGGEVKGAGEMKREEVVEEEVIGKSEVESGNNVYRGRPSASIESAPVEYEVRVVDKKVVEEEGKGDGGRGGRPGFRNVFEVVKEIQVQFERAANSGGELGNVLEVGKLRYQRKNAAYHG